VNNVSENAAEVMSVLRREAPMPVSASELVRWLSISPGSAVRALRRLELEGNARRLETGYWEPVETTDKENTP
jgi:DNA-binding IclR family transcriptional regulator